MERDMRNPVETLAAAHTPIVDVVDLKAIGHRATGKPHAPRGRGVGHIRCRRPIEERLDVLEGMAIRQLHRITTSIDARAGRVHQTRQLVPHRQVPAFQSTRFFPPQRRGSPQRIVGTTITVCEGRSSLIPTLIHPFVTRPGLKFAL